MQWVPMGQFLLAGAVRHFKSSACRELSRGLHPSHIHSGSEEGVAMGGSKVSSWTWPGFIGVAVSCRLRLLKNQCPCVAWGKGWCDHMQAGASPPGFCYT